MPPRSKILQFFCTAGICWGFFSSLPPFHFEVLWKNCYKNALTPLRWNSPWHVLVKSSSQPNITAWLVEEIQNLRCWPSSGQEWPVNGSLLWFLLWVFGHWGLSTQGKEGNWRSAATKQEKQKYPCFFRRSPDSPQVLTLTGAVGMVAVNCKCLMSPLYLPCQPSHNEATVSGISKSSLHSAWSLFPSTFARGCL